jgi:hypothetical protein
MRARRRFRGAELEVSADLDDLVIDATLGVLENSIDSITTVPGTTATVGPNNSLPFTPDTSASLGIGYDFRLGGLTLTPRVDVNYTTPYFFDAANSVEVAQRDAVTTVNANITLMDDAGGWKARLSVFNATDELYPVMGNSSMTTASGYAEIIYARAAQHHAVFREEVLGAYPETCEARLILRAGPRLDSGHCPLPGFAGQARRLSDGQGFSRAWGSRSIVSSQRV